MVGIVQLVQLGLWTRTLLLDRTHLMTSTSPFFLIAHCLMQKKSICQLLIVFRPLGTRRTEFYAERVRANFTISNDREYMIVSFWSDSGDLAQSSRICIRVSEGIPSCCLRNESFIKGLVISLFSSAPPHVRSNVRIF